MNEPDPSLRAQHTAAAYAQELRAAMQLVREHGATQADLARATNVVASTVSRYLNPCHPEGRIAPESFLNEFADFLGQRGFPLSPQDLARLHDLRRAAQEASRSPKNEAQHLREQVALLKQQLEAAQTASGEFRAATAEERRWLDAQLLRLSSDLAAARSRAQKAEDERDRLREQVRDQDQQLQHAARYTRQVEGEFAAGTEELAKLEQEVGVLREQVWRLELETARPPDPSPPSPGAPDPWRPSEPLSTLIPAPATQARASQGADELRLTRQDRAPNFPAVEATDRQMDWLDRFTSLYRGFTAGLRGVRASQVGNNGHPAEAARLYDTNVIPYCTQKLGNDSPITLSARGDHARFVGEAGDPLRAMHLYEELIPQLTRCCGENSLVTLSARGDHARFVGEAGDPLRAMHLYEWFIAQLAEKLGEYDPRTFRARSDHATYRGRAGYAVGAATAFAELLVDQERVLGPDHSDTRATRQHLARWRSQAERGDDLW